MKNIFMLLCAVAVISSCTQQVPEQRYFTSSAEIDMLKAVEQSYVTADWDAYRSFYADTAKIGYNVTQGNELSIEEAIERFKQDHATFSSIEFMTEPAFYEMVVTDEGEKWVNYWGVWVGTLEATGQRFEVPLHITSQFVDGKIVEEYGYWNNAAIAMALMALSPPEEVEE